VGDVVHIGERGSNQSAFHGFMIAENRGNR
jgi:hypothetical protein